MAVDTTAASGARRSHRMVLATLLPIVLLALIGLAAFGVWKPPGSGFEIVLPVLALGGIVALLVAIALVSVVFKSFGIADPGKALALPDGSVRAILALSLLVLFAILSVFLYINLGNETQIANGLNQTQEAAFLKTLTPEQQAQITVRVTGSTNNAPTYSIYLRDTSVQARQDLAKQLIGILATLLSALAGFYFGANTATSAAQGQSSGGGQSSAGTKGQDTGGGPGQAGGGAPDDAAALKALSAVSLPASAEVTATPEASQLGQDPRLASEPDPQNQNRGVVS